MQQGEIILYRDSSNPVSQIEVRVENETIWLNQKQIAELFGCSIDNVSLHIKNVYKEEELNEKATSEEFSVVQIEGNRNVTRKILFYNLDAILSVGYRVNTKRGTQFRIWANQILKNYLLKGYALNQRVENLETKVQKLEKNSMAFDLHIKTSLPPHEGIFFDGQIFDAYTFVSNLIKTAKSNIVLIDNYIDESVLLLLSKRKANVKATIYTGKLSKQNLLDIEKHNQQYPAIEINVFTKSHDRFLIIDNSDVYHIGASLKDLGKKWFAFFKMKLNPSEILSKLE